VGALAQDDGLERDTVVLKFGGSSVADSERIRDVAARLVAAREGGRRVVATVSAMGETTDTLLALARRVAPDPDARELDMLLSTGERVACALVAIAVHDLGHEAVSFTGSQAGILTDAVHTRALIREITPVRVVQALDEGRIVLVAGFQGFSRETMDVTTLGRGGTDATAVALAAALGAACEIYSDVPGVFTADPRLVPDARRLEHVSYEEMLELAASGARVLMLRAVELARAHGVPILARSSFSDEPGTWVHYVEKMEQPVVSAVTHSEDVVVFSVGGVPDRPGATAALFQAIAAEHVNVDTVLSDRGSASPGFSFATAHDEAAGARLAVERAAAALGALEVEERTDVGSVSVVGAGMRSHPGVAAKMFRAIDREGVDVRLVSTSPIKISVLVDRSAVARTVRGLHAAFGLGEEAAEGAAN
jgi:aspartate kinase